MRSKRVRLFHFSKENMKTQIESETEYPFTAEQLKALTEPQRQAIEAVAEYLTGNAFPAIQTDEEITGTFNLLKTCNGCVPWEESGEDLLTTIRKKFGDFAWMIHTVRDRLRTGFEKIDRVWSEVTNVLADTIPGIRVVKAFAQERREVERFRAANDRVFQANCRVNTLWSFFGPIVVLLTQVGVLTVWTFGAWRVFQHDITVGALWLFVAYTNRFYGRMDSMSRMVSAVQRAGASAQRVFAILDRVPSVAEPVRPVQPGRLRGEVEFRGVAFGLGKGCESVLA